MNDEKKKLAIVVVLVAVMACVGVFHVLGGRKAPAPPPAPLKVAGAADTTVGATAAKAATGPGAANAAGAAQAEALKNPELAGDLPPRDPFQAPAGMVPSQNGPKFGTPKPFRSAVKRGLGVNPLVPGFGPGGKFGIKPIDEKPFGWTCVGVIAGANPAAMFEDGTGNQKLVPLGSAIDPDSRLKGIEDDAVSGVHV
jgi:hypothetical protein